MGSGMGQRRFPIRWPRRIFDMMMEPEDGDSRSALFVFILIAFFLMGG